MPTLRKFIAIASFALLQACITGRPPAAPAVSYFWLPLLGVSSEADTLHKLRDHFDALLIERGYHRGQAIALAIATDAAPRGDGSLGLGLYAGGYAYYPVRRAPPGTMTVTAFDAHTLRPLWRAQFPAAMLRDEAQMRQALAAALRTFPGQDHAGVRSGERPDARAPQPAPDFDASRDAI